MAALRRRHRELRGRAPSPAGVSATTSAGDPARHHLRLDVRVRPRGPRRRPRHHGPDRPGPDRASPSWSASPTGPRPGGRSPTSTTSAATSGAIAILAGVLHRRPHRRGPAHRRLPARAGHGPVGRPPPRRRCSTAGPAAARASPPATGGPIRRRAPGGAYRARRGRQLGRDLLSDRGAVARRWSTLMGDPPWADRSPLRHPGGPRRARRRPRRPRRDWTSSRDRYEIMDLLQAPGSRPGVVQDAADRLERDPQLAARGHFTHCSATPRWPRSPSRASPSACRPPPPHTGGALHRGPPLLGEDTDAVLSELLGLTRATTIGRARVPTGRSS